MIRGKVPGVYMNDQLVMAFDSYDPEFMRGFEAGAIWGSLGVAKGNVSAYIRDYNIEMAWRIGEAHGFTVEVGADEGDFLLVRFKRISSTNRPPVVPAIEQIDPDAPIPYRPTEPDDQEGPTS